MVNRLIDNFEKKLEGYPGVFLTIALLVGSGVIATIALFSKSNVVKAIVLAYIVLP